MPKQNSWIAQNSAIIEEKCRKNRLCMMQAMTDYSVIAFAEWYLEYFDKDVDDETAKNFLAHLMDTSNEYADMCNKDAMKQKYGGNGDKQLNYMKGKLDQNLRKIISDYPDWESRYGWLNG